MKCEVIPCKITPKDIQDIQDMFDLINNDDPRLNFMSWRESMMKHNITWKGSDSTRIPIPEDHYTIGERMVEENKEKYIENK